MDYTPLMYIVFRTSTPEALMFLSGLVSYLGMLSRWRVFLFTKMDRPISGGSIAEAYNSSTNHLEEIMHTNRKCFTK